MNYASNSRYVLDTQALFNSLDELRADAGLSWGAISREMMIHYSAFARMRDGNSLSSDVLVTIIKWMGLEDLSPYVFERDEMKDLGDDVDQVCITKSPYDKIGR